ncbi:hypothetical protein AUC47_09330 [Microbacterium sp. SZ1]|uniref:hypothetical protein n=1 Tax=Microbacterium sp. SZ1 TaxID=1849736 RepID=UPI000BBBF199|nr:hypothetical protein [Microbacterium sp. SZ1]PCE16143.1 hypothetical protein AUC47_09330 [Microbacterium sp. SZ1]
MIEGRGGSDENALRRRLQEVEAEHAELLRNSMGAATIGNPELIGRSKELEREADELRARLGEESRSPAAALMRSQVTGWLALVGAVIAIIAGVALLTPR